MSGEPFAFFPNIKQGRALPGELGGIACGDLFDIFHGLFDQTNKTGTVLHPVTLPTELGHLKTKNPSPPTEGRNEWQREREIVKKRCFWIEANMEKEEPPGIVSMKNLVYFDLETQLSASEVGGWQNKRMMKMSIGVTYSTGRGAYAIYHEDHVEELIKELRTADCVIGFNLLGFDYEVLEGYTLFDFSQVPTLDLMVHVEKTIGKRVGLDALAVETFGVGKTGNGTDALKWWKEGRLMDIAEYCCYDVKATKMLHEYGQQHGRVFFQNTATFRRESIAVSWGL